MVFNGFHWFSSPRNAPNPPVRDQIHCTERALAQLFLDLIDVVELLRVLLNELLSPALVTLLATSFFIAFSSLFHSFPMDSQWI